MGGLEAAKALGIDTGGTAPKDYLTEDGPNPSLKKFGLVESNGGYAQRTRKNVDDADATIVFRLHPGNGTDKTIGYAHKKTWTAASTTLETGYKPVLVLDSLSMDNIKLICSFLEKHHVRVVNIAGHRETTAGVEKFGEQVKNILQSAFECYLLSFDK